MQRILLAALSSLAFGLYSCAAAAAPAVLGYWQTIDDNSGEARSIVLIEAEDDTVRGRIVRLIDPPEPDPLCEQCPGDKRDAPVEGLEILWGFTESRAGREWSGGELLDPENGRVYRGRLRPRAGGAELEVRGFVGFSLLGRSQIWERTEAP